ncbi:phosphatase PAP2 family protein [Roseateles sp. PN1]|uniref:phosphatase PAP2 family protein n=1 Tax=Roseateles sp. PN1 TaxID=3137372 RepID=UPI003139BC8A
MPKLSASTPFSTSNSRQPMAWALTALLLMALFAWLSIELSERSASGGASALEQRALLAAHAWRAAHPGLAEVMRDLTALGSTAVLGLLCGLTVLFLALTRHIGRALLVAVAALSGVSLLSLMKGMFARARPDPAFADAAWAGWSFPSGHASMSALVYLTLAVLLASMRVRPSERLFLLGTALLLSFLVGLSRVMLGAHWLGDVLGGWAFGSAWALLCLALAQVLQRRHLAQ